jgi:uncharacterized protein
VYQLKMTCMKKGLLLIIAAVFSIGSAVAQEKQHKVVFEITSGDTSDHSTVLRQINNVLKDAPGTRIEVVCHGAAIFMLVKEKTTLADQMGKLADKGVQFAACANSMHKNNLDKLQLIPAATVVPNGVMEVVTREEEGWGYIKAGH